MDTATRVVLWIAVIAGLALAVGEFSALIRGVRRGAPARRGTAVRLCTAATVIASTSLALVGASGAAGAMLLACVVTFGVSTLLLARRARRSP